MLGKVDPSMLLNAPVRRHRSRAHSHQMALSCGVLTARVMLEQLAMKKLQQISTLQQLHLRREQRHRLATLNTLESWSTAAIGS